MKAKGQPVALLRFRHHADAAHADHYHVAGPDVAQAPAAGALSGHDDQRVHALVLHLDPLLAIADVGAVVGGGVEILRRAAVALDHAQLGVARIDRRAAQVHQLVEHLLHRRLGRRLDFQAQMRRLAVGAADAELLDFEAAAELDDRVEDLLHDVGVDQVALRFDHFLSAGPRPAGVSLPFIPRGYPFGA